MHENAQKCENNEHYFKQKYSLKLVIAFSMAYFLLFQFRGKSRFSRFPKN